MQQKITFSQGIDSDTSPEAFQEGVGRYRIGVRVMNSRNGEEQSAEPVRGNTEVSYSLPSGTNKVVGSFEYELTRKIYYFVYNSSDNHSILEYDQVLGVVLRVFEGSVLNFQPNVVITGINVIARDEDNHLLYWTDGWINSDDENEFNEPKKINIEKGKLHMSGDYVNGYVFPFDPEILYRIKRPPLCAPTVVWSGLEEQSGSFSASNNNAEVIIHERNPPVILQFDNPYYNPNFEYNSANGRWTVKTAGEYGFSSVVGVNNPPPLQSAASTSVWGDIFLYVNGTSVDSDKSIDLATGGPLFDTLVVAATLMLNVGDVVTVRGAVSANASGHVRFKGVSFSGKNNTSEANGVNRLFKKNFQFQVQNVYDDFERSVFSSKSNYVMPKTGGGTATGEDFSVQDNKITVSIPTGNSIVRKLRLVAQAVDSNAPSLIVTLDKDELNILDDVIYEYDFVDDILGIPLDSTESSQLMDWVPLASTAQELIKGTRLVDGLVTENFNPVEIDMRLDLSYGLVSTNANSFYPARQYQKAGQSYVYGIEYQDHGGRIGLVNITKGDYDSILQNGIYGTTLSIPFLTDSRYNPNYVATNPSTEMSYVPFINAEFYHEPPVWATKWKLIRSKGKSIGRYVQFTAQDLSYVDDDGNPASPGSATNLRVEIENITGIYLRENKLSTLSYTFDKGDRIRFIANRSGAGPSYNNIDPFFAYNDSDISSFDELTSILNVPLDSSNDVLRTMGFGALFEIYHPVPSIADDEEFLYETGECGDVETLADGRRVHVGNASTQSYFTFYANYAAGTTGFIGNGLSGFSVGDKVKVQQSPGFQYAEYNTYATVTGLQVVGGDEVVITDIPWKGNTASNGGILTKAAIVNVNSGDCFRRLSNMPFINSSTTGRLYSYIETSAASNMFSSNFYDYGRPNIVDNEIKRITRPSAIRFSKKFIPETFINGLSSFSGLDFEEYDLPYGGIYKLFYINQTLKMFQELKIGTVLVEQIIYTDTQGKELIGTSDDVLSKVVRYYKDEVGIGQHPESFTWYKGAGYGIDVKRGVHWRLANDGLTSISSLYKMDSYYTEKCADILTSRDRVRILGTFDVDFGEYIVAFDEYTNDKEVVKPAETLAFNESKNQWSTFHFYQPEMMSSSGVGIVTFKNGKLYTHDTNELYNNFYGVQYKPQLWFYCNVGPSKVKVFEALSLECKDPWNVIFETPITRQNPEGQHTEMIGNNFTIKEGFPYTIILKDDYTPNTVVGAPYLPGARFNGNPLRGVHGLVKLEFQESTYTKIWACNVLVIPSERSDK